MEVRLHRVLSARLYERVQVDRAKAYELAHLEVADPLLQDQAAYEGVGHPEVSGRPCDVEQGIALNRLGGHLPLSSFAEVGPAWRARGGSSPPRLVQWLPSSVPFRGPPRDRHPRSQAAPDGDSCLQLAEPTASAAQRRVSQTKASASSPPPTSRPKQNAAR